MVDVLIDDDTIGIPEVAACTKAKIEAWRFPEQKDSGEVTFTASFAPK